MVTITAAPGKGGELAQAFRGRCLEVMKEPGCEQFEVFQSVVNPDKLALLERWTDQAALDVHAKVNTTRPPLPSRAAGRQWRARGLRIQAHALRLAGHRQEEGVMGWLDGQVALVTGGGSGIGRAVVERYVEEGARVAVMDRVPGRGEELRARFGNKVTAISGDVSRLDDNKRAVAETVAAFGRLDIFVGNAGVLDGFMRARRHGRGASSPPPATSCSRSTSRAASWAPRRRSRTDKNEGCMIFTASGAGFTSAGGGVIYTASKHAVVGHHPAIGGRIGADASGSMASRPAARSPICAVWRHCQLEDRSQFALPGAAERIAAGNPLQMALDPADLAGAYVFLASRANARGITGSVVSVDAGSTLRMMRRG